MQRWNILRDRLRALFGGEKVRGDIDEEIRSHIELETEANLRRGMSPDEARRAAERSFGNRGTAQDAGYAVRGGGALEAIWLDLRFAGRMLRRQPGLTLSAVLTWALGIGAVVAVFSVVHPVLLRELPFRDPDRLVTIRETCLPKFTEFAVAPGNFYAWQESDAFEGIVAYGPTSFTLTGGGEPERVRALRVTADFFQLLGLQPALGRPFLPEEDMVGRDAVVIVSERFWRRRLGADPTAVHRALTLDDRSYTIVGVVPPSLDPYMLGVDVWVPAAMTPEERQQHGSHYFYAVGRLRPGASREAAQTGLNGIADRLAALFPATNQGWQVRLDPLHEFVVGQIRPTLVVLSVAVAFVLLIACANVASLLLGRVASREREIAVRAALGAGRGRILRQLASESIVLSLLGGALGLGLAVVGVDLLLALAPEGLGGLSHIRVDLPLLAFTVGASAVTGLAVALIPARQTSRADLNDALKAGHRGVVGHRHGRVRQALLAVQVACCLLLLVGAGLLLQSLVRLLSVDPGFDARGVATIEINLPERRYPDEPSRAAFADRVLQEVGSIPGVRAVGLSQTIPLALDWLFSFYIDGQPPDEPGKEPSANYYAVSPEYFQAMGIRTIAGRTFTAAERGETPRVAIVGEKLARQFFPDGDAVGKRIGFSPGNWMEIVGVVDDVRHYGLSRPPTYQLYTPFAQRPMARMTLAVRSDGEPTALAAALRARVAAVDPNQPVPAVKPMTDIVAQSEGRRRFAVVLLGVFAGAALLLAIVGIYGVISDALAQRTREIGVRLALGASPGDVRRLMMAQGFLPALAGLALGLAACFGLMRLLHGLLYGVGASDPATLGTAAALLAGVALVSAYLPARRATRIDPMVALRSE